MAYSLTIAIDARATGLTLKGRFFDGTGAVGSEITTGFTADAAGGYLWKGDSPSDTFAGKFVAYTGTLGEATKIGETPVTPASADFAQSDIRKVNGSNVGSSADPIPAELTEADHEAIAAEVWAATTRSLTDKAGFAPTAAAVRTEIDTNSTKLDVAVSTRSTFSGGAVASVIAPVTVGTNNDKTGYTASVNGTVVLAASQPNYAPAKAGDAMTLTSAYAGAASLAGMITGGAFTGAALINTPNGGGGGGSVIVSGYAEGMSPAEQILVTPANPIDTDASGHVTATNGGSGGPTVDQIAARLFVEADHKLDVASGGGIKVSPGGITPASYAGLGTPGTVAGSPSPAASGFTGSSGLAAVANFHTGAFLQFSTGSLAGQSRKVTGYSSARALSFETPFTSAPSAGDAFVILGRSE